MIQRAAIIAGAFTAIVAAAATAWAGLDWLGLRPALIYEHRDLVQEVAANTRDIRIRRFQELDAKKRSSLGLTPQEFAEWCEIGQRLGWLKECRG